MFFFIKKTVFFVKTRFLHVRFFRPAVNFIFINKKQKPGARRAQRNFVCFFAKKLSDFVFRTCTREGVCGTTKGGVSKKKKNVPLEVLGRRNPGCVDGSRGVYH